jgi:hypothetical protein
MSDSSTLDATFTLRLSNFKPSAGFDGRHVYPLPNGRFMSIDGKTGKQRPGGSESQLDSESFKLDGNIATVWTGETTEAGAEGVWSYPVNRQL